ncbi:MAG: DUF58 domain-containing protein [Deltaproteobacteria bacterium]|nr:DUF58 domain-containing protein [Deltaproteobacteria bacterium]
MSAFKTILKFQFHPRRRLHFTPEGWFFSALALSMGLIAVNTGHNLFYLIFALLLSVVIVSGIFSERVLRSIDVRRHMPSDVTAGVPFAVVVELRNLHPRRISYSLTVSDTADFIAPRKLGYLPSLQPGESKRFHYLALAEKRGCHRYDAVHVATRFPFGLFEKVRLAPLQESFVAYPRVLDLAKLKELASGNERIRNRKRRSGEEILALRSAQPDDDHRLIHWRTSARLGQLMLKEFFESKDYPRPVFFDNRGVEGDQFEHAVEAAASLLRLLIRQGIAITFATWDEEFHAMSTATEMRPALQHLALIRPVQTVAGSTFESWRSQALKQGGGVLIQGTAAFSVSLPPCKILRV